MTFESRRVLRWYPPAWRRRYETEMLAMLGSSPLAFRQTFNLWIGALDAWQRQIGVADLLVPLSVSLVGWRVGIRLSAFGGVPVPLLVVDAALMMGLVLWLFWRLVTRDSASRQSMLPSLSRRATFACFAAAVAAGAIQSWQMEASSSKPPELARAFMLLFGQGFGIAFYSYFRSDLRMGRAPWLPRRGPSGPDRPLGLS